MSSLSLIFATLRQPEWQRCIKSWQDLAASDAHTTEIIEGLSLIEAYENGFNWSHADIHGYIHDDLLCYEQAWDYRILREFDDPTVGIVGVCGALRHGSPDLYTAPYRLPNLGRQHVLSNLRNAEDHGARFTGECDVAVLDGMAIFIRRSVLEAAGGWPHEAGYYMYTEAICCEARRQGMRIRLVGLDVDHLSGKTASMVQVKDSHAKAHEWLYEEYRDVLPWAVGGA